MPKISTLIPVYNAQNTIERCLLSVVEQTFKDIEIIVINDGSTDNTFQIVKKIQQQDILKNGKRIRIINKKNTGYGHSLNIGIEYSKGEYISIIEADDWIEKNVYEIMSKYFDEYEIIKSSFNFIKNNRVLKSYDLNKNLKDDLNNLVLIKPSIWSAIYKKSFLNKHEIRFLNTKGASYQDTSFHFKTMALVNKIKLINSALYNYTIDKNTNSSINSNSKTSEIIKEFEEINNFIGKNFQLEKLISNKLVFEYRAYFWKFLRLKKEDKYDFLKKISLIFKNYDLEIFYQDDNILTIDKLKMKLLVNYSNLFYLLFKNLKGRNDR